MEENITLHDAFRLAVDPPGGVSIDGLRELVRDDEATEWDIAATATHLDVGPHTLRYCERIGLARIVRDHLGHRRYDAASIRRLVFLIHMRISGMSISDIRRYVELVDAGEVTVPECFDMLLEHRDIRRSQIGQLQLALAATEYKIATYKGAPQP